mgnify:CR=1 FL=1
MPLPSEINIRASTQMLGGAKGDIIPDNALHAIFPPVSKELAEHGGADYACIFIENASTNATLYNIRIYVFQPDGGREVKERFEIGLDPASGSPVQTIPNRTTAPQNVTFFDARDYATGVEIGVLPPGGAQALWLKRIIPAGTEATVDTSATLQIEFAKTSG